MQSKDLFFKTLSLAFSMSPRNLYQMDSYFLDLCSGWSPMEVTTHSQKSTISMFQLFSSKDAGTSWFPNGKWINCKTPLPIWRDRITNFLSKQEGTTIHGQKAGIATSRHFQNLSAIAVDMIIESLSFRTYELLVPQKQILRKRHTEPRGHHPSYGLPQQKGGGEDEVT